MKKSIRIRFTMGMIFLFLIILVLSVFSGYYLNKLSDKTTAIHKENFLSVVYAREMSEGLIKIDQEVTTAFLAKRNPDSVMIIRELNLINKSFFKEKNNITEPGEDKLVYEIEHELFQYTDSLMRIIKLKPSADGMANFQNKSGILYGKLVLLSEINGNAIEIKTDEARSYSKSALTQMTILASLCFLIGMSFTFSFSSYFNQRFFQLYSGIKEMVSSNYSQHLYFNGNDEFHEISVVFNEMADRLKENRQKMSVTLQKEMVNNPTSEQLKELRQLLLRIKTIEVEANALISRIEKTNNNVS